VSYIRPPAVAAPMNAVRPLLIGAAALFVTVLMLSPVGGLIPAGTPAHPAPSGPSSALAAEGARISAELRQSNVPKTDVFLPNLNPHLTLRNGTISPDYAQAPAPMGIGDLGVQQVHGVDVGTVSYTSSIEATVTVNSLNSTYVDGFGPDSVSMQLNTVLTNVDLFNSTANQFWIQNVPVYVESTHKLYIVDNIWNFSSPSFDLTANSFWSFRGIPVPPIFYFGEGPTWTTALPFTVHVYNNATVLNDRPTVFLNYSITLSSGRTVSGSYDRVEFNSTGSARPTHPAPSPTFQIDGQQLGANGQLPNDAEIMLGGSDDGCTTSISAINATMELSTLPNGSATYLPVPSAFDFGFDTGETSEGISEWASTTPNPVAHLATGPSLLHPLWGMVGAVSGFIPVSLHVAPANAFVFASTGSTFNPNTAAWAPLVVSGLGKYQLPPGTYSFEVLLADHTTQVLHASGSYNSFVYLPANGSVGIDTPLYAWGNEQLANISEPGGHGTIGHPYVLLNGGPAAIDPLFGEFNDFFFPVFSGVFLAHTTQYVTITNAPTFSITYTLPAEANAVTNFGVPNTNFLQQVFLNVQHVSIVNNPVISGWFSSFDAGTMLANVLFWNSSNNLIADNSFQDMSVAMNIYGGTNTVVSGNTITVSYPVATVTSSVLNDPGNETGIFLSANGDLVYNNIFDAPIPAETPTTNLLTFVSSSYVDTWNVTPAPASHVRMVNGFPLSGNIFGGAWELGNFWATYGSPSDPYGVLPFNAGGLISTGGDFHPLLPMNLHRVTFTESGLPSGTTWSVTLNGTTMSSTTSTVSFLDPNGAYGYSVGGVAGFTASPSSGAVLVHGGPTGATIHWT
jgi:thermopsin